MSWMQKAQDEIAGFRSTIIDRFDISGFASLLYKDLAGTGQSHQASPINHSCDCDLHAS